MKPRLKKWLIHRKLASNFKPLNPLKKSILRDVQNGRNILLIGGVGTGKTSFMKEIGSKHIHDPYYLYRNANIDDIQLPPMIRDFCRVQLDGHKTVFVDDMDAAKDDIQLFIKTIMDGHKNVSFIFAANSIERISRSIQSRCVTYDFNVPDGRMKAMQLGSDTR
jgi:DNA polymerase III delta prime subunit